MIPKIIHQTWKTEAVPERFDKFVESWKDKNPDWAYRFWTDASCRKLVKTHYPWFLEQYDAYPRQIQRVDAARCFILHRHGGVYADLDFECLKPISGALSDDTEVFLGLEPRIHAERLYGRSSLACNALMGSVPRHDFWQYVFKQLRLNFSLSNIVFQTGPGMLQDVIESYRGDGLRVFPEKVFYPIACFDNPALSLSGEERDYYQNMLRDKSYPPESLAVHHWAGTWYRKRSISEIDYSALWFRIVKKINAFRKS